MPKIRSDLRTYFSKSQLHMTDDKLNADEAVAIGAAIMANRKIIEQARLQACKMASSCGGHVQHVTE